MSRCHTHRPDLPNCLSIPSQGRSLGRCGQGAGWPLQTSVWGGKSGLHGNTVPDNVRRGRPQGQCHREQSTARRVFGSVAARVKRCGQSAPHRQQWRWQGKPHREQDRIGWTGRWRKPAGGCVPAVSVGLVATRPLATAAPDEWSSSQNPAYRPPDHTPSPWALRPAALQAGACGSGFVTPAWVHGIAWDARFGTARDTGHGMPWDGGSSGHGIAWDPARFRHGISWDRPRDRLRQPIGCQVPFPSGPTGQCEKKLVQPAEALDEDSCPNPLQNKLFFPLILDQEMGAKALANQGFCRP